MMTDCPSLFLVTKKSTIKFRLYLKNIRREQKNPEPVLDPAEMLGLHERDLGWYVDQLVQVLTYSNV